MGTFSVTIEIADPEGEPFEPFEPLEALVDAGATTTVVPSRFLQGLGVVPTRRETFEYADGRRRELDMAETKVRVEGRETTKWVLFGEDDAAALLGAYPLGGVLLSVDSYNRRLVPVRGLLMRTAAPATISACWAELG